MKIDGRLFSIIATIGPSCNSIANLIQLKKAGVSIFRVNMSHTTIEDLKIIGNIGLENNIEIGLDTEGAQIRTNILGPSFIDLRKGEILKIFYPSEKDKINTGVTLYPHEIFTQIEEGFILRLDFNGACVRVIKKNNLFLECEIISSGKVGNNKGVDILNKRIYLPDFTEKDFKSFELLDVLNINHVFLSFCQSKEAVVKLKNLSNNVKVTSKIESKRGIQNLHSISEVSDALLIDRGDLTREINIMDIPFAQRGIVKVANSYGKPCYIATNVFESLLEGNLPTRAELNDVVGSLEMGAAGIVLAAETAIGKKPLLSVEIVTELIHRYKLFKDNLLFTDIERDEITDKEMKLWLNKNHPII